MTVLEQVSDEYRKLGRFLGIRWREVELMKAGNMG